MASTGSRRSIARLLDRHKTVVGEFYACYYDATCYIYWKKEYKLTFVRYQKFVIIALELDPSVSPVLHHLVNKHVITVEEERSLVNEKNPTLRGEIFVDLFAQKGFNAFRELCNCLEMDCPHLLTSLLLDSTGKKSFYWYQNLH